MNTCWKIVLPVVCRTAEIATERPSQPIEPLSVADIASQFRTPSPECHQGGQPARSRLASGGTAGRSDSQSAGRPASVAVMLHQPAPSVKYLHRRCKDANLYMFFNESDHPKARRAALASSGKVEVWGPTAGTIAVLSGASAGKGTVSMSLHLDPAETRFTIGAAAPSM